jgi:hypothetical protein
MKQTTSFKPLDGQKPPESIRLYGPDGSGRLYAPIDAREILASGNGYTAELPQPEQGVADEQPRKQQPINGDATGEQAEAGKDEAVQAESRPIVTKKQEVVPKQRERKTK